MTDFVSTDLAEDQILSLANTILPRLLRILLSYHQYSAVTRAQCVTIFRQCLTTLYMVKEAHPAAALHAVNQVLPQWLEAFREILKGDPLAVGESAHLYIDSEIFQVCGVLQALAVIGSV